jgi:serine/threonine protein kinase
MSTKAARTLQIVRVKLDQRIGTELGGYRIVEQIGQGGSSVVYRAEHVRLGRPAALKLFSPGPGQDDFSERFLRESRLAASLDHPNLVPIHQAGEAEGVLFIAMRYVEGTDLRALLEQEGPLEPERAVALCEQIAGALDAAHRRGLVHRDVKPANVLLDGEVHAYLADFGLTKQTSSISGLTGTGELVGTVDYVAPEQVKGEPVDGRSDQYALACCSTSA